MGTESGWGCRGRGMTLGDKGSQGAPGTAALPVAMGSSSISGCGVCLNLVDPGDPGGVLPSLTQVGLKAVPAMSGDADPRDQPDLSGRKKTSSCCLLLPRAG